MTRPGATGLRTNRSAWPRIAWTRESGVSSAVSITTRGWVSPRRISASTSRPFSPGSEMSSSIRSTGDRFEPGQGIGAVAGLVGHVTGLLQQRGDDVAESAVVVDHEHTQADRCGRRHTTASSCTCAGTDDKRDDWQ